MAEKKSFVLRISPELWDALQAAAAEDFRSVNGQIEFILTDHLRKRGRPVRGQDAEGVLETPNPNRVEGLSD